MIQRENVDTPQGLAFAITAYLMWGFLPLYIKLVAHIPAIEILAHRVMWSVPIALTVLLILRRTKDLVTAIRTPRMLGMACVTAALVSINWGIYVWAVSAGFAMEAALGYYMNPLFSIALGAILLGEKLSRLQLFAIMLAVLAVAVLVIDGGGIPYAALGMMLSWGFYALAKKSLPIGPNQGFLLEVLILLPFALGYVVYLGSQGASHMSVAPVRDTWLLLGCGVITAVPLMNYANGAKLLRLSTIGILQYIAPTIIFLIAVFVFDEPFGRARAIAFPLIWFALVLYSTSMFRQMRQAKRAA